jgi:hypothetical protein
MHGTQDVCMVNKVRKYYSMCKMEQSVHAAVETQKEYFVKYPDIPLVNPIDGLKYRERQLDYIWRWVCWCRRPFRIVPYTCTFVQHIRTFGAPD